LTLFIPDNPQSDFAELTFVDLIFNPEHPLLLLSAAIDWTGLVASLQKFYSAGLGRPSTPLRAQAAALMLKFIKHLPDRDTVACVHENIYAQRFCGLHPSQLKDFMNPATGLTQFRARIGSEGMLLIQAALTQSAQATSGKKGTTLIVDTTCVPADVLYPTDIRLLEKCRTNILKLFKQAREQGLAVFYRTYSRTARKIFVTFAKLSKPARKKRQRVHKQLFQFVRRNLKQLADLRTRAAAERGLDSKWDPLLRDFLRTLKQTEQKVRIILHQQRQVRSGLTSIPNRIVSFHKDHVRPIMRGKFPLSTEFGPKVLVAVVKGVTHVIRTFQNNVSDATLVTPALRWFKNTFGRLPRKILGDRGFFARWRVGFLKGIGIVPGLQSRGKNIHLSPAEVRMIHQRLPIEAFISLGKRKFGWNKCLARIPHHENSWISIGAAALSAHRAFFLTCPSMYPPKRQMRLRPP
jgi:hypothetical protein